VILYVNGDSHTAAAEAVNPHAFAEDDPALYYLGRLPHPENLAVSWGKQLSITLNCGFFCNAESASSNARILRTTRAWLEESKNNTEKTIVIIQWSTWEREEWLYNGTYYQVGASGTDSVPPEAQEKYRNYIIGLDWKEKTEQAHTDIWEFHQELDRKGIPHIFFNGNNDFSKITDQKDWGVNYIGPYDPAQTYDAVIRSKGIDTVMPNSWHFGREGHGVWMRHMIDYIITNKFV
jgi:hypothetical protein